MTFIQTLIQNNGLFIIEDPLFYLNERKCTTTYIAIKIIAISIYKKYNSIKKS